MKEENIGIMFAGWFIFVALLGLSLLSFCIWVIIKLLSHWGII